MTTYTLKISSCVHTFSNRILTFMSSVHLFMSYIHTFSTGVLTFLSSIHTVTSRFHTFTSRVQTLSPRRVNTFTSRVQTFLPRVHTFTSRVLTFSSSAHTFASIGLVGYEVGSRLFFYWRNFAKSQNEMRKIDFYSILEVFNRQKWLKKKKSPDFHTWFSGLKIFTSHVVYSRIWRNPLMYDRQFGYKQIRKKETRR
jgi:hypothetical protein